MKKLLLGLMLCANVFALQSVSIDASVNNITGTFVKTYPGLALTLPASVSNILVKNTSATAISVRLNAPYRNVAPSSSASVNNTIYVEATSEVKLEGVGTGRFIYVKSEGATISTGKVDIHVW